MLRGETSEARSDPEEAIGEGGAGGGTIVAYAVVTTSKSSNKRERGEFLRCVSLKSIQIRAKANPYPIVN